MPGPSYSWSAFANSPQSAIAIMESDRIMTLVTERMDESLVVLAHYMGWSLADVVVTAPRKALSSHPKYTDWPSEAVIQLKAFLEESGEISVYNAAIQKLDQRIMALNSKHIDVKKDVETLVALRDRVAKVCKYFVKTI